MSLFVLPSDPTASILDYLKLSDIKNLDIATTSVKFRSCLYSAYSCFTYEEQVYLSSIKTLTWFISRNIRVVDINIKKRVSDNELMEIICSVVKNFTHLKSFRLFNNSYFKGSHMKALCEMKGGVLFDLVFERCTALDDSAIDMLADRREICSKLRNIRIINCRKVTSHAIVKLLYQSASCLEILDLSSCFINDATIELITKVHLPRLREIHLNKCVHITNHSLKLLTIKFKSLIAVSLGFCGNVTDAGVENLTFCFGNQLQSLVLSDCMSVTDGSIKSIAANCKTLKCLDIRGCLNLTRKITQGLTKSLPEMCLEV